MVKRYRDALAIQEGACNPSGIAHSIIDACREIYDAKGGTDTIRSDPAVRLMVHQLAFLCGVAEIDDSLMLYGELVKACKVAASEAPEGWAVAETSVEDDPDFVNQSQLK
jgi:hypothetical protein